MRVTTFVKHAQVQINLLDIDCHFRIVKCNDLKRFSPVADSNLFILQINHPVGVLNDRGGITGDEEFAVVLTYTDNHRAALSRSYQSVWILCVNHQNGICSNYFFKSESD